MKLKGLFLIVYIALTVIMFVTFKASILVWVSFFFSAFILFLITVYHLYFEKIYSPFLSSFIVFSFLFFLAAPISQINSFQGLESPRFVNFFPYNEDMVLFTNILVSFFNLILIFSYIYFKNIHVDYIPKPVPVVDKKYLPFTILILFFITLLILLASYNFIQAEFSRPNWMKASTSIGVLLIWKKFLLMTPFVGVILCFQYLKNSNANKINWISIFVFLVLFLIILLWFKNPFTEKRNALGPIYLSVIFLFFPKFFNSNLKTISFLFFIMIIIFPLSAIVTHSDASFLEIYNNPFILIEQMKGGGVSRAFNTLNYDAFANVMATIEYVHKFGLSYGYQLLGGILFFIPRAIWIAKPYSTGQVVGEYLISDFGFNFSNLSNPIISEAFINFGILGVLIFPILLAYTFIRMIRWLKSDNYLKKIMAFYFAMHLIFLLRGDFTNGFSYYIGPLISALFFTKLIQILTKEYLIYAKNKTYK